MAAIKKDAKVGGGAADGVSDVASQKSSEPKMANPMNMKEAMAKVKKQMQAKQKTQDDNLIMEDL